MKTLSKIIPTIIFIIFFVLVVTRIFYKLDALGIADYDEAWHAVNAYEMYRSDSWTINTYEDQVDYFNSKPPLYLWAVLALYKVAGPSLLNFKIPSAIAGVIIFLLLAAFLLYLKKEEDGETSVINTGSLVAVMFFSGAFLVMDGLYDYHLFRSGNFDSFYNMFLMAGIICIYMSRKSNKWLIGFGVAMGLAFQCKSFNVVPMLLAAICCIPFMAKEKRIRHIIYSVIAATLTVLPWAIKRFMFDGLAFFNAMLFGEADDKLTWFTINYLKDIPKSTEYYLLLSTIICCIIALGISKKSVPEAFKAFWNYVKKDAVFYLWIIVPIAFYSLAGAHNPWYVYSSHLMVVLLTGLYGSRAVKELFTGTAALKAAAVVLTGCFIAICAVHGIGKITTVNELAGTGGGPAYPFRDDMIEMADAYGDEYRSRHIYMIDISRYDQRDIKDYLFCDLQAYAEYTLDLHPRQGGIDAWLEDEGAIFVINKDLFEDFADRLVGHVIIQDGGYLFFSQDMY
jgi:4-amino-4-deoxy-L-arabinose transferase-like glycosyltransferase